MQKEGYEVKEVVVEPPKAREAIISRREWSVMLDVSERDHRLIWKLGCH